MRLANPFSDLAIGELFETLLPDFVLAFAFFTALAYAILGKRFDRQRSAVVMSAVIGMSLSIGLVWWEQQNGFSIRDLGPLAVGFAIIILASVMYQGIRQTGGSWAGVGIALGASLLVSRLLGISWPADAQVIQTITLVAIVVGIMAFLIHHKRHKAYPIRRAVELPEARRDMADLYRGRQMSDRLTKAMRRLRRDTSQPGSHPRDTVDVVRQLQRMLPAEGWLTERMATLREKAHRIRKGHGVRIKEIQSDMAKLPIEAKKRASQELVARYKELRLDQRIERLDKAVAENERRIRQITQDAQQAAARYDHEHLASLLKAAEKLQKHNSQIFKIIDRSEQKLSMVAQQAARAVSKEAGT